MLSEISTQYLTPAGVADAYAGLTVRWLARRRWAHLPPSYIKAGKRVLYRRADVEAFLADSTRHFDGAGDVAK